MPPPPPDGGSTPSPAPTTDFVQTRWSVVLGAKAGSFEALSQLCEWYREPLRRHLLRRGVREDRADDLIQEFLAGKLVHGLLFKSVQNPAEVSTTRRFRTFLMTCLDRFVIDRHRRRPDPADAAGDEPMLELPAPADGREDEAQARADWAEAVLRVAEEKHRREFLAAGKPADAFELYNASYSGHAQAKRGSEMATLLGLTENALYVAKHRFAARRSHWLKEVVKETVDNPEDWENEVRDLLGGEV